MAVGDIITAQSAANTALTFTPAAGVAVLITVWLNGAVAANIGFTATCVFAPAAAGAGVANIKFFIDNTNPLVGQAIGVGQEGGICGIEVA